MLPGASTGHRQQPTEFASPYITRANGVTQGQHFPFTFPSGPGPFPNFKFGSLMPLYVPGYYNKNKTHMAEHYNFSIQRQLDKSTVLTVAYVGTQGHHIERGVDIIYGRCGACQSLAGCGPGGEGGVYNKVDRTIYGTFTGADRQPGHQPELHTTPVAVRLWPSPQATWLQNSGNSNYNSLQVSAERRARDMTFLRSAIPTPIRWMTYLPSSTRAIRSGPMDIRRFDMRHNLVLELQLGSSL